MHKEVSAKQFWGMSVADTLRELETTPDGLSESEARTRAQVFGRNEIDQRHRSAKILLFLEQFKSPLIFMLLIAGGITLALKDFNDALFIFAAALINAALGFYQENKAEAALSDLRKYVVKNVRVFRQGVEKEIPANQLVPGDIMYVAQGDRMCADARLIYANDISVDQAILTGESMPVEKTPQSVSRDIPLADRKSMIYSGTTVAAGIGHAVVTAIGSQTELGKIARAVEFVTEEQTPLQKALAKLSVQASAVIILFSVLIFFVARASEIPLLEAFLISVAVLVAAVPEGLPIVMTVILAIGVQRLARKNGVVRRLSAAETLGSTTVILTDKTGTLTQAKLSLSTIAILNKGKVTEEMLLRAALLNIDVAVENPTDDIQNWKIIGKPLEVALAKEAANRGVLITQLKEEKNALHFLPFNSRDKFSASVCQVSGEQFGFLGSRKCINVIAVLGAPEMLIPFMTGTALEKERLLEEVNQMAAKGERVIAVGIREIEDIRQINIHDKKHFNGITLLGTISFRDPLRPGVAQAIQEVHEAGIRTVIVTGDHAGTAIAIARELGMSIELDEVIAGTELDKLTDGELDHRLKRLKIVSRVSPEGKMRIAKAFQRKGEIVAMNGDGINDAPGLRQADIGIAMGSGTDVAKDVADLILLDDNFETIVAAIKEGRRIIENLRRAIVYLSSTIFNEILLIGGSIIAGIPLPLTALQILWVNFFTDSFPGLSLAFEEHLDGFKRQPAKLSRGLFTGEMRFMLFVNGLVSSILLFIVYIGLIDRGFDPAIVKTFIFSAFGTYSLFLIFAVRSLTKSIFRYNPFSNMPLVMSVVFGIVLMTVAVYFPPLQRLFGTVALSAPWVVAVIVFGIVNILFIEITKYLFRERETA